MKYETIPIRSIIIGERYRKEYGDIESLSDSIGEKGVLQPVLVDTEHNLLAGGRRIAAAEMAGLDMIPVCIIKVTGEIEASEIELIENIQRKELTWSERGSLEKRIYDLMKQKNKSWNMSKQAEMLGVTKGTIGRRITLAEVIESVPELGKCNTEDKAWKTYKRLEEDIITTVMAEKAEGRVKEAFLKAEKHYMIGNALGGMAKVKPETVEFAEVDPPYAVDLLRRKSKGTDPVGALSRYNEVLSEDYPKFLSLSTKQVFRILKDNTFCVWWYGISWHELVKDHLTEAGFRVSDIPAIWVKGSIGQTKSPDTMLASSYETFFVCSKGSPKLRKPGRVNVFSFDPVPSDRKIHPTEKPIQLMREILETFAYTGYRILSPFLGSGVTLRAAYLEDMIGYGWDFDNPTKKRFLARVVRDQEEDRQEEGKYDIDKETKSSREAWER